MVNDISIINALSKLSLTCDCREYNFIMKKARNSLTEAT